MSAQSRTTARLSRLADRMTRSPRRLWLVSFALFMALAGAWSAATPLGASPDEHAHFIRAAAVARGQFGGTEVMVKHTVAGVDGYFAETGVQLPAWYRDLSSDYQCYAWEPRNTANCMPKIGSGGPTVQATTAAGRYHPAYYLFTGLPTLVTSGPAALYLMRLLSAGLCAALLASAMVGVNEWRRRAPAMLGLLVAATPMALFMAGMVNPSGGEIAAGILVWTAALSILMSPDPLLLNRRLARLGLGGVVLINIRPLGLFWFAGAIAFALLLQQRGAVRQVLRRKALWLWAALLGASAVGALAWAAAHPDNSVIDIPYWYNPWYAAKTTFAYGMEHIEQMIGFFGWLDTKAPPITWVVWIGATGLLAMLTVTLGNRRQIFAVIAMTLATLFVPAAAQAAQYQLGPVWQGRYLLPFAVGLPLLCGFVLSAKDEERPMLPWRRLTGITAVSMAGVNALAFYWTLRRYALGTDGSWLIHHARWLPPLGWLPWLAIYTAAALLVLVPAFATNRAPGERPERFSGFGTGRRSSRLASVD
ncbi:DUF2142 domain-containing protein [Kitasatospora sp. NPDC049285]|uniref:DUF2142 domain-containing protein n=1 Tax=Kitasatospora sp. NPDC049285 TaxID=3157096 RepID=UPI0034239E05